MPRYGAPPPSLTLRGSMPNVLCSRQPAWIRNGQTAPNLTFALSTLWCFHEVINNHGVTLPDYFMLGNAPVKTHDHDQISAGYDVLADPDPDTWWIAVNGDRIQPGDYFALYHHPTTSFVAVGVFTSFVAQNWVGISCRFLKRHISANDLAPLAEWRTTKGSPAKPFSRNPDGTPNATFANGTRLSDDRWATIWQRISGADQRWLRGKSRQAVANH